MIFIAHTMYVQDPSLNSKYVQSTKHHPISCMYNKEAHSYRKPRPDKNSKRSQGV